MLSTMFVKWAAGNLNSNFIRGVGHIHSTTNCSIFAAPRPTVVLLLQKKTQSYPSRTHSSVVLSTNITSGLPAKVFSAHRDGSFSKIFTSYPIQTMATKAPQGIHENISALQMKKRPQRKKRTVLGEEEEMSKPGFWNVMAYATAEEYDLERLTADLVAQDLYEVRSLMASPETKSAGVGELDVVHATARYSVETEPREIFFFREGTSVFWNMTELESSNILAFVRSFEQNSYDERLVQAESDAMAYAYSQTGESHLAEGNIYLATEGGTDLDKYTFSNALALSVKLGIWEASLDRYVDSIEFVVEDLKRGSNLRITQDEVLRKTGELFSLRHLINLSSDLLDTPDFYWDRDHQEALYHQTCSYLSIQKRTRVMNEKLNHCVELVELLSSVLNDRHHVRLEWMIIILIMVEVGFETLHFAERFLQPLAH